MGSITHMDPKLPGRPLELLTRNHLFQSAMPEPPPPSPLSRQAVHFLN